MFINTSPSLPPCATRCWRRAAPRTWKASWLVSLWGSSLPTVKEIARSCPKSAPLWPFCRTWRSCPSSLPWRNPRRTTRNAPKPSSRYKDWVGEGKRVGGKAGSDFILWICQGAVDLEVLLLTSHQLFRTTEASRASVSGAVKNLLNLE